MQFTDRADAGRRLAAALAAAEFRDAVVVALPRGGVPVAAEVARALRTPLDVCVIRKVGAPGQPELAMGAVGEDGARVVNQEIVDAVGVAADEFAAVEARERAELARRAAAYRRGHAPLPLAGRTVLVVDDGVATGSTALAACRIVRARGAARVVLAVPVAPHDWTARLGGAADEYVAVHAPSRFLAVGEFYRDFRQTTDAEVIAALDRPAHHGSPLVTEYELPLAAGPAAVAVPDRAAAVVLFAHGSGSNRASPRNRRVAAELHGNGLATVLFDLLTPREADDRWKVFDPGLLGGRLVEATHALNHHPALTGLPFGYFGASTGAAAALWAAAEPGVDPGAIVSRGGRPDLAEARLPQVEAPTLLIVGGADEEVVELNRRARAALRCPAALQIVPGAGHLFEEPGALEVVAELAAQWFVHHLTAGADGRPGGDRGNH
ncbi:phosphoribosyltransferase family protein [Streptomyces sp. TLI_171]|uniref:phosphoribosyltransferase family protein n=1 Tax=Streptomyces sp. TLI_171 TaxID=1938859 RepID=UPI000C1A0DA2|nr:phosphoribosyltransferase family protein [Streptomyces sp. TLI_171]RKE22343.1 putative phosphoribosyltransferase [Streptomyces sp. TLI_171]